MLASFPKTDVQYRTEAAEYESAFRELGHIVAMPRATDADVTRITSIVGRAGFGLDYLDSWMAAACSGDLTLETWVRSELSDEAGIRKFTSAVKLNPRSVDVIPGVTMLVLKLEQLQSEKARQMTQIVAAANDAAGIRAALTASRQGADAIETAMRLTIARIALERAAAIVNLAAATVRAAATIGAAASAAVAELVFTYRDAGADLVKSAFVSANERYAQCVASASSLAPAARAKALAACQARWLAEKAVYLG
jgi:3-dehydroquinate synthase class II